MNRHGKDGQEIGNRHRPGSPRLHFCGCHACAKNTCTDPTTGLLMKGCFISATEIDMHQNVSKGGHISDPAIGGPVAPSNAVGGSPRSIRPQQQQLKYDSSSMADVLSTLSRFETEASLNSSFNSYKTIVFSSLPHPGSQPSNSQKPNHGAIFDLLPSVPENMQLIHHRDQISQSLKFVSESNDRYGSRSTKIRLKATFLQRHFQQELIAIDKSILEEWNRRCWILSDVGDHYVDMSFYTNRLSLENDSKVLAIYIIVLVLHSLCGLSMEHCKFVLGALAIVAGLDGSESREQGTRPKIVTDIRTVQKTLCPDIPPQSFVCCPKCFYLYPLQHGTETLREVIPERCTNKLHPDSEPCLRKLWNKKKVAGRLRDLPTREFLYRRMKDWLAWMYSRPDIERLLDEDPTSRTSPDDLFGMDDIWDAGGLRDFRGPGGENPFYKQPGNEARLIFSLNMDGFNPYTNKEAGKKVSTGGIYMVCLNLPRSIRYKEENIYQVAIIPGPHEPSLHEINYLLKPMVDELLEFWDPGFFYSHTPSHPQGRWVRCALVPLVCDLPAARQMCGSAHYTSNCFCSYCWQKLPEINHLNYPEWELRTTGSHRKGAELWLKATTQTERDALYAEFGTRWSELLRLPYWDPVKFTVIDPMHAFYLRIIPYHCRELWGMDASIADDDIRRKENDPTEQEMKEANIILRTGTSTQLKALTVDVLRELCVATTTLKPHGRKNQLYSRLVQYRERNGWPAAETPEAKETSLNEEAVYMFSYASKSSLLKVKKETLLRILRVAVDNPNHAEYAKVKLLDMIQEERRDRGIVDDSGNVIRKNEKAPKVTAVLGKETLAQIRADMAKTSLPSWFSPSPKHPGEKKWGKLTASNWRSFALVNLPITLIRLWGQEAKSSRKRKMLDNFMHLVSAVKIAGMRRISADDIAQYQEHIHAYLTSLQDLYPKASTTPYQHLSLHFSGFLERFGPTHAWQCFPFERYNHLMQEIPTNQKFGEMEKTMFRKFRLSQLVRSFFSIPGLTSSFRQLSELYEKAFSNSSTSLAQFTAKDGLPHDLSFQPIDEEVTWSDKDLTRISSTSYALLKQWLDAQEDRTLAGSDLSPLVFLRSDIVRLGQKFATSASSLNNSHVLFRRHPVSGSTPLSEHRKVLAGDIQEIFSHTRRLTNGKKTETFVVVAPFKELSNRVIECDPYREYPLVSNRIFEAEQGARLLIPLEQVISHFASVPITIPVVGEGRTLDCILAYPLDT